METPDQRAQRFRDLRENIVAELLEKHPDAEFNRHEHGIDLIYYIAHFDDGIHIRERKRGINTTVFSLKSYYLTRDAAQQAICKHVDAARQKAAKCLEAFRELETSLEFSVSYTIEGDTYGVDDYPCISFEMGGFSFTFAIDK